MIILTNNPMIKDVIHREKLTIEWLDTDYIGVLEKARDAIHNHYQLLTHPLYGSVKPNETVYRTIVMEKSDHCDFDSLYLIEEALATAKKFMANSKPKDWPDEILDDFQVVDSDLIKNAVDRII